MGGNSSGGSAKRVDTKKLRDVANAAISSAFSRDSKAFLFCDAGDLEKLKDRVAASGKSDLKRALIVDSSQDLDAISVPDASLIILFTADCLTDDFLNLVLTRFRAEALSIRHVKNTDASLIPSRVSLYRIASVSWEQFLETLL